MNSPYFDDETVMAFADGEADAETSARIEAALETDDDLMARVATFMETRAAAKEALAPMLDEPVPDALMASVRRLLDERKVAPAASASLDANPPNDNVIAFTPRHAPTPVPVSRLWLTSVAASVLVAVIAGGAGYFAGQSASPQNVEFTRVTPAVAGVLETRASANEAVAIDGGAMRVVSSFQSEAGEFCREFEFSPTSGQAVASVACHTGGNWEIRLVIATAPHAAGYLPAGAQETIDTYLGSIGVAGSLSPKEEAEAVKALQESRK